MGTLVDELERNNTIDTVRNIFQNGCPVDVIIKTLVDKLKVSEEEAKEIFETEIK